MGMHLSDWLTLAVQVLTVAGVVPAVRSWLAVGRRARMASLVAQLAQEVLVALARRHGVAPEQAASLEGAAAELEKRLLAVGIDPKKAPDVARAALDGAMHPADESVAAAARRKLLGG